MSVDDPQYDRPLFHMLEQVPGLSIATTSADAVLEWGAKNSLWVFAMATSCCAIEFMTAAASRVDLDQMGAIIRPTPRHCDVMVVAGTITVKMAPRVRRLWDQMPEPKWCIAMGSCAISGDFYRDIYSVVPGVDTFVPVDVYIPGCPPNADQVMEGLQRLQQKISEHRAGGLPQREGRPERDKMILPQVRRTTDTDRDPALSDRQLDAARGIGLGGNAWRDHDSYAEVQGGVGTPKRDA